MGTRVLTFRAHPFKHKRRRSCCGIPLESSERGVLLSGCIRRSAELTGIPQQDKQQERAAKRMAVFEESGKGSTGGAPPVPDDHDAEELEDFE